MLTELSKGQPEKAESPDTTIPPILILVVLVALPAIVLAFSRIEIIDDAYISYRYALNLTNGNRAGL